MSEPQTQFVPEPLQPNQRMLLAWHRDYSVEMIRIISTDLGEDDGCALSRFQSAMWPVSGIEVKTPLSSPRANRLAMEMSSLDSAGNIDPSRGVLMEVDGERRRIWPMPAKPPVMAAELLIAKLELGEGDLLIAKRTDREMLEEEVEGLQSWLPLGVRCLILGPNEQVQVVHIKPGDKIQNRSVVGRGRRDITQPG